MKRVVLTTLANPNVFNSSITGIIVNLLTTESKFDINLENTNNAHLITINPANTQPAIRKGATMTFSTLVSNTT